MSDDELLTVPLSLADVIVLLVFASPATGSNPFVDRSILDSWSALARAAPAVAQGGLRFVTERGIHTAEFLAEISAAIAVGEASA